MAEVITIAAQKGGTGKTTTAAALAEAAAYKGKNALALDLDTGGLSFALDVDDETKSRGTTYDLITGTPAEELIIKSKFEKLDAIPAALDNMTLKSGPGTANRLKKAIEPIQNKYDYIIIDSAPGAGEMQYNALIAADKLIIPVMCGGINTKALFQFAGTVEQIQQINKNLIAFGILANYSRRTKREKEQAEILPELFNELNIIDAGRIRTGSKAAEAIEDFQENIFTYAKNTGTAKDYLKLFNFITERR